MAASPTSYSGYNQGILVINPNTLAYGTYMFTYSVTISTSGGSVTQSATTYVKIVPTGLNVFGFQNGILEQTYATGLEIVIDAGSNTIDLDGLAKPSSLNYTFYCQIVPNGQSGLTYFSNGFPISNITNNVYQVQSGQGDCFSCK
jgi:hypothetical protein